MLVIVSCGSHIQLVRGQNAELSHVKASCYCVRPLITVFKYVTGENCLVQLAIKQEFAQYRLTD